MDGNSPGKKRQRPTTSRAPNADGEKTDSSIELEHVLGISVYSGSALTCHPMSGLVAYPAGCVLVLLDSVKNKQVATLHTPRKSITAASFSPDGRYVLTGESGLQPAVRVWDISRMHEVATLKGHSVGIFCVSFSPRMREIIVVGDAQDMIISVWAWPAKTMKALNKFSDTIYAMDVAEDSTFFVTAGNRHIKFYNLDTLRHHASQIETNFPIPLPTRCGLLDNLKENCFCDVACGRGRSSFYIFVVSVSGLLCQVNRNRLLERWVDVNMTQTCCVDADEDSVFVGGSQGLIRVFHALSLQIILTLPRPHSLGLDIAEVRPTPESEYGHVMDTPGSRVGHPCTRALVFDYVHSSLTVVYDDHSLYIWSKETLDRNLARGGRKIIFKKRYSSMYHRGCVWDVKIYPILPEAQTEEGDEGGALPPGALVSVSSDGTLRAWDMYSNICEESLLRRNCLSAECLKIVYTDQGEQVKKTNDRVKWRKKTRPATSSGVKKIGKQCFTVLALFEYAKEVVFPQVCPNGIDIATGNRHGRITVYDANTMKVKVTILAHEAELTAMKYSSSHRYKVLASGSRDRMIHVMDASKHYQLLTTLDDHSSTITSINFTHISRCLMLVSSSLDKSVLVRAYLDSSILSFKPVRAIVEKKSVMDFTIHPWSGLLALACQDKLVRVYGMLSSIEDNSFRGCPKCGGQLIKIQIDPSGQYLLTACSNKTVNLIQFSNGNMISTINGHAESITSISFSHNMKHVITSAVDGCIFLWRLPQFVTYVVRKEMAEMGRLTKGMVLSDRWKKSKLREDNYSLKENEAMRTYHESLPRQPSSSSGQVQTNNTDHFETKQCQQINNQSGDTSFSNKYKPAEGAEVKPPLELQSKAVATSEAWLNACDERRRKFKLEAQSIHKILAMMRLVTEAMEKDLANADWIMSQPDSSLNPCPENEFPPNHDTAPTPEEKHQPQEQPQQLPNDGIFEMIFAKSLPNCNNWQVNAHAPKVVQPRPGSSQGEGHDTPQEEGSEGGSSVYEKIQRDWSTYHMYKQENKSFSNSLMSKPLDHVTIKLTRDSNVYHCVGTFAFFNELDGFNYSSAVNHITQAMENKQRTNRSMIINSANDNNPMANRSTTINSSVPNSPLADRSMVIQSIVPNPQMANRSMVINSSVPITQMHNRALVVNSTENKQMANRAMVIKSALKSKQMANRSITTNTAMESKPIANRSMVINTDSNTKIRTNNAVVMRSEMISKQKIRCDAEVCCERENRGSNDFNKNNIVLKTFTESMLSPLEADVLDNRLTFHSAQLEQKAPKAICNLSLALANPQGLGDFGISGGVLRFSGQCASFTQKNVAGKTAVCETANAQVCCTLRVDAVGHNAQCSQESSESVIIDLGISFKAFIEELGQREGMATPPHAMLTKDKMPELTSETSETVVTSSREHRPLRHKGKKLRSGTSGDTESMRSSDSANRYPISGHNVGHSLVSGGHSLVSGGHSLVSGGHSLVRRCGQGDGDVGQSITLEKLLLKPDTVLFEFANMKEA